VLLIDDIQFLQGKVADPGGVLPHLQHPAHNANKQVVITSDLPPKQLAGFERADAVPVRVGSDHRCAAARTWRPGSRSLPQEAIGRSACSGARRTSWSTSPARSRRHIRELEGALIRVTAFASLNRQQVDLSLAEIAGRI